MKGFIYLIILYTLVFALLTFVKYSINKVKENKGSEKTPAPKIYYIENATKKPKTIKPDIAIKGSIVEKEDFYN